MSFHSLVETKEIFSETNKKQKGETKTHQDIYC